MEIISQHFGGGLAGDHQELINGSAKVPAGNSRASPVRSPCKCCKAVLYKTCYHLNQSLAQPELRRGADAQQGDSTCVCTTGDQRNPVMVSDEAQPFWVTQEKELQQMILCAFTEGGNVGTTKVTRSGFMTMCNAVEAAASFSGWGSQTNGTCSCF